jgi:hypothetical protein
MGPLQRYPPPSSTARPPTTPRVAAQPAAPELLPSSSAASEPNVFISGSLLKSSAGGCADADAAALVLLLLLPLLVLLGVQGAGDLVEVDVLTGELAEPCPFDLQGLQQQRHISIHLSIHLRTAARTHSHAQHRKGMKSKHADLPMSAGPLNPPLIKSRWIPTACDLDCSYTGKHSLQAIEVQAPDWSAACGACHLCSTRMLNETFTRTMSRASTSCSGPVPSTRPAETFEHVPNAKASSGQQHSARAGYRSRLRCRISNCHQASRSTKRFVKVSESFETSVLARLEHGTQQR